MAKVKCDICGRKVSEDRAYRITRYDMAYAAVNNELPVQTVCRDCLGELGGVTYDAEEE